MTQALVFDNDDLNSFEAMLHAAVRILYNFKHERPKIALEQPHDFDDGRYENWRPDRPYGYNTGERVDVLQPFKTFSGTTFLESIGTAGTEEEAARIAKSKEKSPIPERMWIATIYDYPSHYSTIQSYTSRNHDDLVEEVMKMARAADREKFRQEFRDAECPHFDGSFGCSYRMQWRPSGAMEILDISMVHAMYGK